MKILINSLNYAPELTGIGKYNGEMCKTLTELGAEVKAIVAKPYYPEWRLHPDFSNYWYSVNVDNGVLIYRCPLYVPKSPTLLKRLLHLFSFSVTSGVLLFWQGLKRPDVILVIQPSLVCAPMALLIGKLTGAKTVMHIQDFELDAMFGLKIYKRANWRFKELAESIESWLLKKFDMVSTISHSMADNAKRKGVDVKKLTLFPNWSDVVFVNPHANGDPLRETWGFEKEHKLVLYSGNIGEKQGLEIVVEAAEMLKHDSKLKFVFVGAGVFIDKLKKMVSNKELSNVYFFPLVPWENVPQLLAMADIHLVIQKRGVSNAVLPSKLTNILAAGGNAIVSAEEGSELRYLSGKYPGIFQCIDPEDTSLLVSAITLMLEKEVLKYNKVAREFAINNLSRDKLLKDYYEHLYSLIQTCSDN